jgi:hypothetical protein
VRITHSSALSEVQRLLAASETFAVGTDVGIVVAVTEGVAFAIPDTTDVEAVRYAVVTGFEPAPQTVRPTFNAPAFKLEMMERGAR